MKAYTWTDVGRLLKQAPKGKLWGVPRGGAIVAGLTGRAVDTPEEADWIVDDLIDSGATMERVVKKYHRPFWAMIDKRKSKKKQWIVFPWEHQDETTDVHDTVRRQLEFVGEDPTREGLADTPRRVIKSLQELTEGYAQNPKEILKTTFTEKYDEMIVVREIEFWSLCEHHMLPFRGTATVGYIPNGKVVGLSKIARLVRCFSRRLQIQERLTQQIAHAIKDELKPLGVGVVLKATHLCMEMRGVKSPATMVTSCLLGLMRTTARNEFLSFDGR